MRNSEAAKRDRRVLRLQRNGRSQREIAELLGLPHSTVAYILKRTPGYAPRPTLATFTADHGRITASQAAKTRGLKLWTLCQAIDRGEIPGAETVELAGGRRVRVVDEKQLDEYLANRPACAYEGCEKRAGVGSRACSGPHARAIATQATTLSSETRGKMAAGKRGKPRPDVKVRVDAMHADPETHHDWRRKTMKGRFESPNPHVARPTKKTMTRVERAYNGVVGARAAGRVGGKQRGYSDDQIRMAKVLTERDPRIGRTRLARLLKVTEQQARAILNDLREG
jgi:hypothetical protein